MEILNLKQYETKIHILCEPQGGLPRGGLLYQQQPQCTDHVAEPSDHRAVS